MDRWESAALGASGEQGPELGGSRDKASPVGIQEGGSPFGVFGFFNFNFFFLFRAAHMEYGSSQVRGQVGAATAGVYHSHSSTGSEPCLLPVGQFPAWLFHRET